MAHSRLDAYLSRNTHYDKGINSAGLATPDAFPDDAGRDADLSAKVAKALMEKAPELLAEPPKIEKADVLADRLLGFVARAATAKMIPGSDCAQVAATTGAIEIIAPSVAQSPTLVFISKCQDRQSDQVRGVFHTTSDISSSLFVPNLSAFDF